MQIVSIPQMQSMISHLGIRKRRSLMFHGPSGIGKSEGIHQSCAEHGGTMCDIRVSQYESIDFRGIPDIQAGTTVWNMPATLPFKGNTKFEMGDPDKPIFLFLDEINQGDPSVMSVCYQLLNDRRIGEFELMDNVVLIAAGNRAQDRGTTNRMPAPLNNRMTHAELNATVPVWADWAAKAGVSSIVIGFLHFREELLTTFNPDKPEIVFATPRTWKHAADDFADDAMPQDIKIASISGTVGEGPGVELMAFADIISKLTPIEQIIANPTKVPVPTEMDVQWAMATHVAGHMNKETADQLHLYLDRMEPEMVVMAWVMAINKDDDITDTDAFLRGYAPKYRSLFTA